MAPVINSNTFSVTVAELGTGTGVAIPFTGTFAYHCVENRSQYISLSGVSENLTYTNHTYLDDPNIAWSTRYAPWYVDVSTQVGSVAFSAWEIVTVPSNGTLYKIAHVTDFTTAPVTVTAGYSQAYPDGFLYVPDTNYTGTDSFTYRATDATGTTNIATIEVVVTAAASYPMPLGIPDPGFGINESAPADPGNWPTAEAAGYYYIDADHLSADDTENTYGYPDKPRVTIPGSGTSITGPGKIVIKAASSNYTLRAGIDWHRWDLLGSAGNKVWVVGVNDGPNKPVIAANPSFTGTNTLRLNGSYYVIDGIIFDDVDIDQRTDANASDSYKCVRHCEHRNWQKNVGGGGTHISLENGGSNTLIFGCYVHNNGRVMPDLALEHDYHGVTVTSAEDGTWYLDSLSHNNAGDTFQAGNNGTGSNIRIGRTKAHSDGENFVDIKGHTNFTASQCDGWDYRTIDYGNSGGKAQIFYINDEGPQAGYQYFLNNRAWDTNGICFGSSCVGGTNYFIGNFAHSCPSGNGIGSLGGGSPKNFHLNTVLNCENGIYTDGARNTHVGYYSGNYIVNSSQFAIVTRRNATGEVGAVNYNSTSGNHNYEWGSNITPTSGDYAAWNAATGFGANDLNNIGDDLTDSASLADATLAAGSENIGALLASVSAANFPNLLDVETDLSITLTDFNGTTRPQNTDYDIGADEK